jgi:hypothetical protein
MMDVIECLVWHREGYLLLAWAECFVIEIAHRTFASWSACNLVSKYAGVYSLMEPRLVCNSLAAPIPEPRCCKHIAEGPCPKLLNLISLSMLDKASLLPEDFNFCSSPEAHNGDRTALLGD